MRTVVFEGNWNIVKGRLKQKFAELTDNDLVYIEGKEDELLGRIARKTGVRRSILEKVLREECGWDG